MGILMGVALAQVAFSNPTKTPINLGVLIPWTREWEIGPYIAGGAVLGVRRVQELNLLPSPLALQWQWRDDHCRSRQGMRMTMDMWSSFNGELHALVGSACSVVCEPVANMADALNIPFVSFGCTSESLSDKFTYPTFTRTVGTWRALAPMFDQWVDINGWSRVAVVTTDQNINLLTCKAIVAQLERSNKKVFFHPIQSVYEGDTVVPELLQVLQQVVRQIKNQARSE